MLPSPAGVMPFAFSPSRNFCASGLTSTTVGPGKPSMLCGCSGGAVAAAPGLVGAADAVVVAEADADAEPLEDEAAADVVVTGLEVAVESSLPHATSAPPVASAKAPTAIDQGATVAVVDGVAKLPHVFGAEGTFVVSAVFSGSGVFTSSTAESVDVNVTVPTPSDVESSTSLTAPSSAKVGTSVQLKAVVSSSGATSGTVQFFDGTTPIDPMRSQSRAFTVGIVLAALGLAGCAVLALFRPQDKIDQAPRRRHQHVLAAGSRVHVQLHRRLQLR